MRLILIYALMIGLLGCSNKKREMLCKTWQVSDVQFINEKDAMAITDTMQGNQLEVAKFQLRDILMKNIYEFRDDGTYVTGNQSANAEGNWKLENNAIKFFAKKGDEVKEKLVKIEKFERDTLVLLMQNDQTSLQVKLMLTPLIVR